MSVKSILSAVVLMLAVLLPVAGASGATDGQDLLPEAHLDANGLHVQPWFKKSTGDLKADLAEAQKAGKILALMWEQQGCSYCARMHAVNFRNPETVGYITDKFYVVQMDMRGKSTFKDFDGETREASDIAARHRVTGTPMIEFHKDAPKPVFKLPGYAPDPVFRMVFEYVFEGGYEIASIQQWIKARMEAKQGG